MSMNAPGLWSARALVAVGASYAAVLAWGIATTGFNSPIDDPILAVMEVLTLVSAPLLVVLLAAVHATAAATHKAYGSAALGFMVLVAGLTSVVHFVGLTALRQLGNTRIAWPSPMYAIELLAWDVFLGLSLLCAAPVFLGGGLNQIIRRLLRITGSLCIAGTLGPATGDMRLQFIAVAGYGLLLPTTCVFLARFFRRSS